LPQGSRYLDEYVCVTVCSRANEASDAFNKRLIDFWTTMIRTRPEEYAQVYAETARFQPRDGLTSRQYLVELSVAETLATELTSAGIAHDPIDLDEIYSKYEATPPEWFQIPH
jgi:hypothetical protein